MRKTTSLFIFIIIQLVCIVVIYNHLVNKSNNIDLKQQNITKYFDSCRKYNSISSDILWGIRLDIINGVVPDYLIKDRIYCNQKANLYQDSLENCLKP